MIFGSLDSESLAQAIKVLSQLSQGNKLIGIISHVDELKESDRPLVFICNLGQVAGAALQKVAHADSYRLDGGISNWKAQGLPLVKSKTKA
jgi:rhodanese-related sulfurtransferase